MSKFRVFYLVALCWTSLYLLILLLFSSYFFLPIFTFTPPIVALSFAVAGKH